jgi:CubicO group peptidase (beta-lactamase class C family)
MTFFQFAAFGLLGPLVLTNPAFAAAPTNEADREVRATGKTNPQFASFDQLMISFLKRNQEIPGAALAVKRDGQIVYARGFGYADMEKKQPVEPNALFRIASISKTITAAAILQLAERGRLKLDDHVFNVLQLKAPAEPKATFDERWKKITIRQLLWHTGGWDRDQKDGFDPMFRSTEIVQELHLAASPGPDAIIKFMLRRPLDFEPGEKMVYSNFGYCLLGRIIAKVSGQNYEAYVKKEVLAPLGITTMKLGRTLLEHRAKGEVKYYGPGEGLAVLGPQLGAPVPWQYGGWNLEAMAAHGGWIASAEALVHFAAAFDEPAACKILKEKSIQEMFARPHGQAEAASDGKPSLAYYGFGWGVRPLAREGALNTWHSGSLNGTSAIVVRRGDGMTWAVLFNSREGTRKGKQRQEPAEVIGSLVHEAADAYLNKAK